MQNSTQLLSSASSAPKDIVWTPSSTKPIPTKHPIVWYWILSVKPILLIYQNVLPATQAMMFSILPVSFQEILSPTVKPLTPIKLLVLNATKVSTLKQPLNNARLVILSVRLIPLIYPMSVQLAMLAIELSREIVLPSKLSSPIFPTQIIIMRIVTFYLFS